MAYEAAVSRLSSDSKKERYLSSLQGCEMLRIPRCLDNRLTDGGEVVSPSHRPRSTPQKHFLVLISVRG
jgi:hypothetical protein